MRPAISGRVSFSRRAPASHGLGVLWPSAICPVALTATGNQTGSVWRLCLVESPKLIGIGFNPPPKNKQPIFSLLISCLETWWCLQQPEKMIKQKQKLHSYGFFEWDFFHPAPPKKNRSHTDTTTKEKRDFLMCSRLSGAFGKIKVTVEFGLSYWIYPPGNGYISHLGKRKIIFKMPFSGDMLVSWMVNQKSYITYLSCGRLQPKHQSCLRVKDQLVSMKADWLEHHIKKILGYVAKVSYFLKWI